MPTGRAFTFTVTALLLYAFGNQTQVGWLYVMSALLAATVLAAWWHSRSTLRRVTPQRLVGSSLEGEERQTEFYEGDWTAVRLEFHNLGRTAAAQVRTTEHCPLAAPDSPQHSIQIFIPVIPAHRGALLEYEVELDRRGVYTFPPLDLTTRAPFGFFQRRRRFALSSPVLVYPEVRTLPRLDLLTRQMAPQTPDVRAGLGTEFLGVRPYRVGDSPRHIHWRSVARTGQLISKEFAAEAQPGLTLVIDLFRHPYSPNKSKHTPFEWAVKVAASLGDYALHHGYPLYLATDEGAWPAPPGPLSEQALLEYLARVQPTGSLSLAQVLQEHPQQNYVAVVLPWPDPAAQPALATLQVSGRQVLAVLLDPSSFPGGGPAAAGLAAGLAGAGPEVCLIRYGEDWSARLAADGIGGTAAQGGQTGR